MSHQVCYSNMKITKIMLCNEGKRRVKQNYFDNVKKFQYVYES